MRYSWPGTWARCWSTHERSAGGERIALIPAELLVAVTGLATGISLGALGSGGAILAVPAFHYGAGLPVRVAVPTSLLVVGSTALIGGLRGKFGKGTAGEDKPNLRAAGLFLAGSLPGAYALGRTAHVLSDTFRMGLFAVVVLCAAAAMVLRREKDAPLDTAPPTADRLGMRLLPLTGLLVGALSGIVGVGGGFLIVPALVLLAGIPVKQAMATSLWAIAATSAMGFAGAVGTVELPWGAAALFLVAALPGMAMGQYLASRARAATLRAAFAVFLVVIGLFMLYETAVHASVK